MSSRRSLVIFSLGAVVPSRRDGAPGVTAVHIVTFELLRALAARGHRIVYQPVFNTFRADPELTDGERVALTELRGAGVNTEAPVRAENIARGSLPGRVAGALLSGLGRPRIEAFYPAAPASVRAIEQSVTGSHADVVLTVWSPEAVALTRHLRVPRVAYHGDIDYVPTEMRLRDAALFPPASANSFSRLRERRALAEYRAVHLQLMMELDAIANVTAANAEFYRRHGHPGSHYVANTWPDIGAVDAASPRSPVRIIGHLGYLNRTGSTYGLDYLLREIAPRLRKAMADVPYEIHIIGGGQPAPAIDALLDQPNVIRRGFVPDLQAELRDSHVVLLLNNAGPYTAAYTRHVVSLALGLCLIVHQRSHEAIPELRHTYNVLSGGSPDDIVACIRAAATDAALNARIRRGARETYERSFTPAVVAAALESVLHEAIGGHAVRPEAS